MKTSINHPSPIGCWRLTADDQVILAVQLVKKDNSRPDPPTTHPLLAEACKQLDEYFAGQRKTFDLPLAPQGTVFQRKVWDGLRKIPYGTTISYAQLARSIAHPKAFRAVGSANGKNPIAIIIPCHRVIRSDGQPGGYAYGTDLKKRLLDFERGA
jgi:methylated-DNA-[protein]-cysteine S-methyltransferase